MSFPKGWNVMYVGMYTSRAWASSACPSSARLNCTRARARARDELQNLGSARLAKGKTLSKLELELVHCNVRGII
jgi:hypothetical protein